MLFAVRVSCFVLCVLSSTVYDVAFRGLQNDLRLKLGRESCDVRSCFVFGVLRCV